MELSTKTTVVAHAEGYTLLHDEIAGYELHDIDNDIYLTLSDTTAHTWIARNTDIGLGDFI